MPKPIEDLTPVEEAEVRSYLGIDAVVQGAVAPVQAQLDAAIASIPTDPEVVAAVKQNFAGMVQVSQAADLQGVINKLSEVIERLGGPSAANPVPVNTSPPVLGGVSQEGQFLTVDVNPSGWLYQPSTFTIIWEVADDILAPPAEQEGADDQAFFLPPAVYTGKVARAKVFAWNEGPSGQLQPSLPAYTAWSAAIAAAPSVPAQVTGLTGQAASSTSIQLAFPAANGATSYEYQIGAGAWTALPANKLISSGLTANGSFSIKVRGVNSVGAGTASAAINVNTPSDFDGQPLVYVSASGGGRAQGLAGSPSWIEPAYNWATDIPGDAVYLSSSGNWNTAVTAARATGSKSLVIDQDIVLNNTNQLAKSNLQVWGKPVSGRAPKVTYSLSVGQSTPCLFYCVDGPIKIRYVEFIDFGEIVGLAVPSINNPIYPYHGEGSSYAFGRYLPAGTTFSSAVSVGVAWGGSSAVGEMISGTFDICDCTFRNCEAVGGIVSDGSHPAPVKFQRCKLIGTYGGLYSGSSVNGDLYCCNVEWTGCTGTREITTRKSNHMHGFIVWGPNNSHPLKNTRKQNIYVENCWLHDNKDSYYNTDVNACVGVDIRNCNPNYSNWVYGTDQGYSRRYIATATVSVSYNIFENLEGIQGQEDCNAIYGKPLGILIERNIIKNCGSWDLRNTDATSQRNGTETSGVIFKNPGFWLSTRAEMQQHAIIIRYNEIYDPPTHRAGQDPNLYMTGGAVLKVDGDTPDLGGAPATIICGNKIHRWRYQLGTGPSSHPAAIRTSNQFPNGLWVEDNDFIDCPISLAGKFIILNSAASVTTGAVRNNYGFDGPNVTYTGNQGLIDKRSAGVSVSGNKLIAAAAPDASATYSAETSTPSAGTARLSQHVIPGGGATSQQVTYNGTPVYISTGALA